MTGRYDVVVIGAGHNGLVTACYLARAGLSGSGLFFSAQSPFSHVGSPWLPFIFDLESGLR